LFSLNRVGHGDEHTGRRAKGDCRRSAGSVLRSLRKLGGGGAFALCARGFGVRFQGSLRTDPAPLGVLGGFWEADAPIERGLSGGVIGDGAWLRGVLVVSTLPHGVF
jgi:hypothetical protein